MNNDYDLDAAFQDILDQEADETLGKEAKAQTALPTVRSGAYRIKAKNAKWASASDESPWPGRLMLSITAEVFSKETNDKVGTVNFSASPVVYRDKKNRLDGPSVLFGHLVNLYPGVKNSKIKDMVTAYPLNAYITESYKTDEGWRTARDEATRQEYESKGFRRANFVQNLGEAS